MVYESSAIVAAIAESIADAIRDDDDGETALDKFLQAFLGEDSFIDGNLFQDMIITGKIPYAKNIWSLLQGFDNSDMVFGGISNLIKVFEIWRETVELATGDLDKPTKVTYYGKMTTWGKVYKTLQSLSQVSGFPVSGMMRDVFAIWNSTAGNIVPYWKIKTYDGSALTQSQKEAYNENLKGSGITEGQYQQMRKDMDADGNGSLKQDEVGAYLDEQLKFGNITGEQAEAIWKTAGPSWKKTYSDWSGKNATKGGPSFEELLDLNENPDRYDVGDTAVSYDDIDLEYIKKGYYPVRTGDVRVLEEWQPHPWTMEEYQELANTVDQMVDAFPGYEDSLMFDYVQEMYLGYLDDPDYLGQTFDDYLDSEAPQMYAYGRRYKTGSPTKATRRQALYDDIRLAVGGMRYAKSVLGRGR